MKVKKVSGFSVHCHHDILVEWCYDYDERVRAIKQTKPKNEIKTRLKLFKLLPKEAIKDIPRGYVEAYQKWVEADKKRTEAYKKWVEAYQKWVEADKKQTEAYKKWSQKSKDAFHKKWCGCKEYKDGEIQLDKIF